MAQQIKSFGMSAMTIGSCSDFHTQVNKLITAATPAVLHVAEKAAAYSDSTALLASIVNRQRSFIASVNGLVGTYSGIAGSSSKGGKAEGGDTPEPEPEPAE